MTCLLDTYLHRQGLCAGASAARVIIELHNGEGKNNC
jgi:hypothetical protein